MNGKWTQTLLEWLGGPAACHGDQLILYCGAVTFSCKELTDRSQVIVTEQSIVMVHPDAPS